MKDQETIREELKKLLVTSVKKFYEQDGQLVNDDLCERALTFRIGLQLAKAIENSNRRYGDVHSEFNKAYDEVIGVSEKSIFLPHGRLKKINYPDLLLFSHDVGNKIIIEIKKLNKLQKKDYIYEDISKLWAFTHPFNEIQYFSFYYHYPLGAHLILENDMFLVIWYVDASIETSDIYLFNNKDNIWLEKHNINLHRTKKIKNIYTHEVCGRIPAYTCSDIKSVLKNLVKS